MCIKLILTRKNSSRMRTDSLPTVPVLVAATRYQGVRSQVPSGGREIGIPGDRYPWG